MQYNIPAVKIIYTDEYNLKKYGELEPATDGSAGYDVRACIKESIEISRGETALVDLGIRIHIDNPHYAALLIPRSGLGVKGLVLGNLTGLIDSDYQGPVKAALWNRRGCQTDPIIINPGDKIAQLLFIPVVHPYFQTVDSFEATERGGNGFGSTGVA